MRGAMSHILSQYRIEAARKSDGISNDWIYDAILNALHAGNGRGDCLDFGAGRGTLLQRLKGYASRTGADLYERPPDLPPEIQWHTQDLNDPLYIPAESFDTIISSEVIEHLENPRATAREWFRLLRGDGLLVCSTPNNESLRAILSLIMRRHFIDFTGPSYPAHITPLMGEDLKRVLSEAGFCDIRFSFTNRGAIPKLPRYHWQQVSKTIFKGLRFSDNVIACARKPIFR
jgi:2-polyprenyl-3-methyl-5-hydroxy-6-metoxy-1,4-benzoquinol methylase